VDNSRIEEVLNAVANNIGVPINQLPVAGSAPEYVAEKAVSIAAWLISLGLFIHLGDQPNVAISPNVVDLLTGGVEPLLNGKFYIEADPHIAAPTIIDVIESKRSALGI
jgi:carbon-monoxide dehydrogenase catalytic subunit